MHFRKRPFDLMLGISALAAMAGCASSPPVEVYSSETHVAGAAGDLVAYYLPKQLLAIDLDRSPTSGEDTLTLRLLPPVPDTTRRFYAYVPRAKGRDAYMIQTTESGLLTSMGASADDPGGQVLARIATASAGEGRQSAPCKATVIVDPTVPSDLALAEKRLRSLGAEYRFELAPVGSSHADVITSSGTQEFGRASLHGRAGNQPGLFYRRAEPYVFAIYKVDPSTPDALQYVSAVGLSLANKAPVENASVPTVAVTASEAARFQAGMLAARPGPLIAGVPADVWKSTLAQPRKHFTLKFSTSGDQSAPQEEPADPLVARVAAIKALMSAAKGQEGQSEKAAP